MTRRGGMHRTNGAAAVVIALALAGCTGGPGGRPATQSGTTAPTRTASPSLRQTASEEDLYAKDGFAVWPEDTLGSALAAAVRVAAEGNGWRLDPKQTALRFA